MASSGSRRTGVFPAWVGIALVWGATVMVEVLARVEWLEAAIAGTTLAALIVGVVITRQLLARSRQPLITVGDLRRR